MALLALAALGVLAWALTSKVQDSTGPPGRARPTTPGSQPGSRGPGGGRAASITVGVAQAMVADIPVWLDALGTVTPSSTVTVRSQVSGVLRSVRFREGELVRAGQLLAEIDPRPFEMALMQAQGQRLRDEAQLDNARLSLGRYQRLLQQDSIARQEVDTQAALVRQFEGTVMADKATEGTARLNLANTRIVSPVAGRVGLRVVDVGNLVSAGDAAGVAVVTTLAPIDVEFSVPQDRVPDVQRRAVAEGARLPVSAYDRTRSKELDRGAFSSLNNQVDADTGTVRAKARFANAQAQLFPSQFVNVRVLLDTLRGVITVPGSALRHGSDGNYVFVLRDDRTVSLRPVTAGLAAGDRVAVTAGLVAGEVVITEGADRLKDGAHVQLPVDRAQTASGVASGMASGAASGPRRAASGSGQRRRGASGAAVDPP